MKKYIIYSIECFITGEIYIGTTTQTLKRRMTKHTGRDNHTASKEIINRDCYMVNILEELIDTPQNINILEIQYINLFDAINKNKKINTYKYAGIWKKKSEESPIIECECGSKYKKINIRSHLNSKRHSDFFKI